MFRRRTHGWWPRVFLLFIPVVAAAPVMAQENVPPVLLSPLAGAPGVSQTLAESVTDALELTLRLSINAPLERVDFLTPHIALAPARAYYERVEAERAIFGTVAPRSGGGYVVAVSVWDADEPDLPTESRYEVESALDIFGVADELALQIASDFVGRELAFGDLVIGNLDGLPEFAVYADDNLVARNQSRLRLISGTREVVVARPGDIGDELVERFTVTIPPGGIVDIALTDSRPQERERVAAAQPAPAEVGQPDILPLAPDLAEPSTPVALRLLGGLSTPVLEEGNALSSGGAVLLGVSYDLGSIPAYGEAILGFWNAVGSEIEGSVRSFSGFVGGGLQAMPFDPFILRVGLRAGYGVSSLRLENGGSESSEGSLARGALLAAELALQPSFGLTVESFLAAQRSTYYALQTNVGIYYRL
ncbi:MAG: hypothetical protein ACOC28_07745 [Alkalispirochaetaceae bacterium]